MSPSLRIATLNMWGRHGDWPRRREVLREGFAGLRADLVALQETIVTDGYDQVLDVFGDEVHIVHQGQRSADGLGCSVVSRFPPLNVREVGLCVTERVDPAEFLGRSTAVEVDTAVGRVVFVNHKPSWQLPFERERELQAVGAAKFVEELVGDRAVHVVVAGDFDARPETASVRFWTGRQSLDGTSVNYQDAWEFHQGSEPGHTFTTANPLVTVESDWSRIPPRRIDYLLVRCDERGPTLRVRSCEQLFGEPVGGVWASDHIGVTASLEATEPG
jgi:endonuclease/exonuclease/phosphatase family metal-dependent hydrolase